MLQIMRVMPTYNPILLISRNIKFYFLKHFLTRYDFDSLSAYALHFGRSKINHQEFLCLDHGKAQFIILRLISHQRTQCAPSLMCITFYGGYS